MGRSVTSPAHPAVGWRRSGDDERAVGEQSPQALTSRKLPATSSTIRRRQPRTRRPAGTGKYHSGKPAPVARLGRRDGIVGHLDVRVGGQG